jgi:hypothetical protein
MNEALDPGATHSGNVRHPFNYNDREIIPFLVKGIIRGGEKNVIHY